MRMSFMGCTDQEPIDCTQLVNLGGRREELTTVVELNGKMIGLSFGSMHVLEHNWPFNAIADWLNVSLFRDQQFKMHFNGKPQLCELG